MSKKLNIIRIYDVPRWAYYNSALETVKYSRHNVKLVKWTDFNENTIKGAHVVYMPGPDLYNQKTRTEFPNLCKKYNVRYIGGYSGPSKLTYSYADVLVAISPQNYQFINQNYPKNVPKVLIPEGIDGDYFRPGVKTNPHFRVGYAGSLHDIKRPYLLKVLKYGVTFKTNWGNEFFKEDRTLDDMIEWYHQLNCLVLTSESECCPRVVLEAMSCGIPIVATDVGFIKMFIGNDWVVPVNPEKIVVDEMNKKLDLLYNNPDLREIVGKANRSYVDNYISWRKLMPIWDTLFEAVYDRNYQVLQNISSMFIKIINTL